MFTIRVKSRFWRGQQKWGISNDAYPAARVVFRRNKIWFEGESTSLIIATLEDNVPTWVDDVKLSIQLKHAISSLLVSYARSQQPVYSNATHSLYWLWFDGKCIQMDSTPSKEYMSIVAQLGTRGKLGKPTVATTLYDTLTLSSTLSGAHVGPTLEYSPQNPIDCRGLEWKLSESALTEWTRLEQIYAENIRLNVTVDRYVRGDYGVPMVKSDSGIEIQPFGTSRYSSVHCYLDSGPCTVNFLGSTLQDLLHCLYIETNQVFVNGTVRWYPLAEHSRCDEIVTCLASRLSKVTDITIPATWAMGAMVSVEHRDNQTHYCLNGTGFNKTVNKQISVPFGKFVDTASEIKNLF